MAVATSQARTLADVVFPRRERAWVRDLALALAMSAFTALCARIAIPLPWTPVPITGQTLAVLLTGALLGPRLGALAMVFYLLEGLLGLPVFAMGRNAWSPSSLPGLPVIIGPTAGYLFSYPLAAALIGTLATRGWDRRPHTMLAAMLLSSVVILSCGYVWYVMIFTLVSGVFDPWSALLKTVIPFIPGDITKALIAAGVLPSAWRLVQRAR
ncbi:biotin transporter BioY [Kallotenue papyrolyticum]|uniref:biotin transporter BioY n=1 Tax=Kallotenue papyrolyticum TaxID=1325125 RepID=UPI000478619B|nr:biotin transporter BioY [Kallotenue papyrolyticum]